MLTAAVTFYSIWMECFYYPAYALSLGRCMQMCAMKPLKISGLKVANLPEASMGRNMEGIET